MARYFIDRPIFAWVLAIVMMLAGLLALSARADYQPKAEKVVDNVYAIVGPLGQRSADNDAWPELETVQDWFSCGFVQPVYEQVIRAAMLYVTSRWW